MPLVEQAALFRHIARPAFQARTGDTGLPVEHDGTYSTTG